MALTLAPSILNFDVLSARGQVPCLDYGSTDPGAISLATLQAALDQTIQYLGPAPGLTTAKHPSDSTLAYFEIFVPDPNGTTYCPYSTAHTWAAFYLENGWVSFEDIGFPSACTNSVVCVSCDLLGDFGDGECNGC